MFSLLCYVGGRDFSKLLDNYSVNLFYVVEGEVIHGVAPCPMSKEGT